MTNEEYLTQLKQKYFFALKGGEVPIHSGFHGDLLFTYIHDGPILAIDFNAENE